MKSKALLIILALMICSGSATAQNRLATEGYVWSIGLAATPQLDCGADIVTSHGYSFGNGFWMGGGLGLSVAGSYDGVLFPIFGEAKYSFLINEKVSPFIDSKLGYLTNLDASYSYVTLSVGVDINRISVFFQDNTTFNVVQIGAAYNF